MLDTKPFKLVAKGALELCAIVTDQPFWQPVTHELTIVEDFGYIQCCFVREEQKFSSLREVVHHEADEC
jgi:hypothetical protein